MSKSLLLKSLCRRLFSFSGREGRFNYVVAAWLIPALLGAFLAYSEAYVLSAFLIGIMAAFVAPFTARRLHDCNFSAWWLLTSCCSITFFSQYQYFLEVLPTWFLILCVLISAAGNLYLVAVPGQKGTNRYGQVPTRIFSLARLPYNS